MSATTPTPKAAPDDATDKTSDDDSLGYDAYAKTLWARIEQALNRDAITGKLGDDPLVVGIFGEWGAGKSFLLNAIRNLSIARLAEQKARREDDPGDMLTIPVWFQAWKYEHEEYLHVPLLLHVMNALKDALREPPSIAAKTVDIASNAIDVAEKIAKPTGRLLKAADAAFPIVQKILGSVSLFGFRLNIPDELGEWLETAAGAAEGAADDKKDDAAEKKKKAEKESKDPKSHVTTATRDGLYFYRIHELLAALTRPGRYEGRRDLFEGAKVTKETRINFVVFVDDLDRCLPEKAVAVLELIKTVFNVESFAFVLALDDEVIERGIGHRYSAYLLTDKKPQMPITGFEYLEKIVHLPFRLPALSELQALDFAALVEKRIEPNQKQRWFEVSASPLTSTLAPVPAPTGQPELQHGADVTGASRARESTNPQEWWSRTGGDQHRQSPHLRLLLRSFDGYAPRKILRAVELWHQVCRVSREREGAKLADSNLKWLRWDGQRSVSLDTRVIFALILLQLFQPELFRFMRRRVAAFPTLLGAFGGGADGLESAELSDIELWNWASFRAAESVNSDPINSSDVKRPRNEADAMALIANFSGPDAIGRAYRAQRVRVGIAERLVEHFATQRHVFNPLKLLMELATQLKPNPIPDFDADFQMYFVVLAKITPPVVVETPISVDRVDSATGQDAIHVQRDVVFGTPTVRQLLPTFRVSSAEALFDTVMAQDSGARADMRERFALRADHIFDSETVKALQAKFLALAASHHADGSSPWNEADFIHAVGALSALAPWLYWDTGGKRLVRALAGEDSALQGLAPSDSGTQPNIDLLLATAPSAKSRAVVGDMLQRFPGGDPRFDPAKYWLPWESVAGGGQGSDILAGFVRIPDGKFTMGHVTVQRDMEEKGEREQRNTPHDAQISSPFYIARMLTTVDQYARFVADSGYVDAAQNLAAGGKSIDSNREPLTWSEQRANGNHPVTRLNWFQARAYARWLDSKLRADGVFTGALDRYAVRLPNEVQWERAARATGLGEKDWHQARWPFGNDETRVKQLANVGDDPGIIELGDPGVERVSSVGMFASTRAGLFDMAGNAWEWMDNRFEDPIDDDLPRVELGDELIWLRDDKKGKALSLRGGSWDDDPEDASCSYRFGAQPGSWYPGLGVRMVLSLAKSEA